MAKNTHTRSSLSDGQDDLRQQKWCGAVRDIHVITMVLVGVEDSDIPRCGVGF